MVNLHYILLHYITLRYHLPFFYHANITFYNFFPEIEPEANLKRKTSTQYAIDCRVKIEV